MNEYESLQPPPTGYIAAITDPHGASIYIDGILQPQKTSILLANIPLGRHIILFTKAGYESYTEDIVVVKDRTTTSAAILSSIATIIDRGLVICTGPNILTCPLYPIDCPILVTPLDYINIIAIISSTDLLTLTVRFVYSINGIINNSDALSINLSIGTNIVYAFSTNIQQPADTILSLEDVILI